MSVDILGTSWDQCRSMVQYSFTSTETRRLVRTDSPGRPPRLSHSSWTMIFIWLTDVLIQASKVRLDKKIRVVRVYSFFHSVKLSLTCFRLVSQILIVTRFPMLHQHVCNCVPFVLISPMTNFTSCLSVLCFHPYAVVIPFSSVCTVCVEYTVKYGFKVHITKYCAFAQTFRNLFFFFFLKYKTFLHAVSFI